MKLLQRSFTTAIALAGMVFSVSVRADFFDSKDSTELAEVAESSERLNERAPLFERETEPLDEFVIGKWIAKVDYLN